MSLVKKTQIGMLVFPQMTSLDILGPFEVLARAPDCEVDLVWKDLQPIEGDTRLRVVPTQRFDTAPPYDVIVVPGGPGQTAMMEDEEFMAFLRTQGAGAGLVTSICTGSLLLAAAGLLTGYKATCHWLSMDILALFDVHVVPQRAGVTSGLDFAFTVVAALRGEEAARGLQLMLEYDPAPPFDSGHPRVAASALVDKVKEAASSMLEERRTVSARVAKAMAGK